VARTGFIGWIFFSVVELSNYVIRTLGRQIIRMQLIM
jgi:hypothetical protein